MGARAGDVQFGASSAFESRLSYFDGFLLVGCVAAGLGVTLLPRALIGPVWREALLMHALPPHDGVVETVFVRRRDSYLSSALAAFLEAMRGASSSRHIPLAAQ